MNTLKNALSIEHCFGLAIRFGYTILYVDYSLQLTVHKIIDAFISIIIKGTITMKIKETEHKREEKGRRRRRSKSETKIAIIHEYSEII